MKQLIDEGRLPQPKRTIRFIWIPEWYGMMAYIDAHPEMVGPALGGSVLANVNMDMVGEHLEILHSRMGITRTPDSIPSVLNPVMANMAEMVDGMNIRTPRGSLSAFNYRITGYSGGSDHMMFIDRKIPGTMIGHSDYTHHSSEDTIDKVDPVELERSELIGTGAIWYLANLDSDGAADVVHLALSDGLDRLSRAARRAGQMIRSADAADLSTAWFEARNLIDSQASHARETLTSVLFFADSPALRRQIAQFEGIIEEQSGVQKVLLEELVSARAGGVVEAAMPYESVDGRVPVRTTRGPLDFGLPETRLYPESAEWYATHGRKLNGDVRFEIANFIDGQRTVTQIRNLISAEFGPIPQDVIAHFLGDLVTVGVLNWEK